MDDDELQKVSEGLSWMIEQMDNLPEKTDKGAAAMLQLSLANSYVVELRAHLVQGVELREAVRRTVAGELKIG